MGEPIPFRRRSRRLPVQRARHVRPRAFTAGQIRLAILTGLLLGLLAFQATRYWPPPEAIPEPPFVVPVDPYAEARRSRAKLEAQEDAPPPVEAASGSTAAETVTGGYRVIDGDTFDHDGARIRIADIDTPEVQGRCPEETALAARATRRLRVLLAQGPFELHELPGGRERDQYGRELRIVTRGGQSLGDVLVAEGLARTWTGRREPWC